MLNNVHCGQCIFYMGNQDKRGTEGVCMRHPPSVFPMPVQGIAGAAPKMMHLMMRPTVNEQSFCGDFQLHQRPVGEKLQN